MQYHSQARFILSAWRVDVIAVEGETGEAKITHFENVVG